jgi:hypothetical protein
VPDAKSAITFPSKARPIPGAPFLIWASPRTGKPGSGIFLTRKKWLNFLSESPRLEPYWINE